MIIRGIIRFCVREPWLALLVALGVAVYGFLSYQSVPIDAIPNVGENQVIVLTPWPGRSPKDIEDQITYPLSVTLSSVPGSESVRGKSMFGYSFVQITFSDQTDFYWARSRVAEQLGSAASQLPAGVTPQLGPDATALGQILYYVLQPSSEGQSLADLRSLQDFVIKYELQAVRGVSEVASIGGYVRQYQVEIDPDRLRYHGLSLDMVLGAIRSSNMDVGAKTIESTGMEFIVRGRGFLGRDGDLKLAVRDIENTVVSQRDDVPVRIKDLGRVQVGPDFRRGALDFNGVEAVGGVVVMKHGENPRAVIQRVKEKISQIEPALQGVKIKAVYDRTGLIDETIQTLTNVLRDEILMTVVVVLLFLLHIRGSLVVAFCLPFGVLISFAAMRWFGVDSNIMSLAGIGIAIGTMVDMSIILAENIYGHLADAEMHQEAALDQNADGASRDRLIEEAATEVAPAVVTAVATTLISFLPVFFLTGRDARLFSPLAYTKSFAIAAALVAAVTMVPALSKILMKTQKRKRSDSIGIALAFSILVVGCFHLFWQEFFVDRFSIPVNFALVFTGVISFLVGWQLSRERIRPIDEIPTSRWIRFLYAARLKFALDHKWLILTFPVLLCFFGAGAWFGLPALLRPVEQFASKIGADLNELPGYVDGKHLFQGLQGDDWIALDEGSWFYMPTLYPAVSFSQAMQVLQTQDVLIGEIPEVENVLGKIGRVESALDPAPVAMIETYVMLRPKSQWREGVTKEHVWDEINRVATLPGVTPASALQPIEGRVVMLQSGIKAPMAIRVYGDDLERLGNAALSVARTLKKNPLVDPMTVNPDLVMGKPYIEFSVDRDAASRYGMSIAMVNEVIETALGGTNLISTVEGRERYPVRLRYPRDLRERVEQLVRLPVVTPGGASIPLGEVAKMETTWGPGVINSENARLVAHVSFMPNHRAGDLETVESVEKQLRTAQLLQTEDANYLGLPAGYSLETVGSFRNQLEANRRLTWIIPLVVVINLGLIYLQFRDLPIALAVFTGIPVAFAGGLILVALMQIQLNTAVWVGFIALFGLAVDDGVLMATYIRQSLEKAPLLTRENWTRRDLRELIYQAGLKRIRPCVMTTLTTLIALVPILIATGKGADVARAMAVPVFGGMLVEPITSFILPTLYCGYLELKLRLSR
ncbi:MAG: efflux RND transporter permease subunit [Rubripirellula sp.]|nr:efflux RND transporter permease subunit [Rubripirellula sp.]